ncbi:hypothetical protein EV191_101936 [Tamaricihabitans halophyticus]|uniref:Uncharacterized protein n=1 Tax=Tamaricihabitans halophyticus TaxID=1262583 RepID=A0A4V2SV37_9PSEU|nr:hypothetical protein [Tamaricihabitans halophyticus]TCP56986.1 hypothetical protein EV191_101936 [Tamaricihabitans halophyticus]
MSAAVVVPAGRARLQRQLQQVDGRAFGWLALAGTSLVALLALADHGVAVGATRAALVPTVAALVLLWAAIRPRFEAQPPASGQAADGEVAGVVHAKWLRINAAVTALAFALGVVLVGIAMGVIA